VKTAWRNCEIKACRLHLGQSWWRKIQSLGLSKQYGKKDSEVSQFMKKLFGLSLLPLAEVSDCFAFDFISNLPDDKRVEQFCDYLLENYIDADSTFPPPVWSECSASSFRTTKESESFHARFNVLFYSAHPNIFVLVSALQKVQNETCIRMISVSTRRHKKSARALTGQDRANMILRIEFVQFLPNTDFNSLSPAFSTSLATSVSVHMVAQKIAE
jgi:hypothetical protein